MKNDKQKRKKWDKKYNSKPETKEKMRNYMKAYYHLHKDKWIDRVVIWQSKNKEKTRIIHQVNYHKRRKNLIKNGGNLTTREWIEIKGLYGFTCPSCNKKEPEIKLTIDHIIPISVGGRNEKTNIQPLCGKCNGSKFTKIIKFELLAGDKLI